MTAALAAFGPFFAVAGHPPGAAPVPPWRPLAVLAGPSPELRDRVESARAALAARRGRPPSAVEPRVAASTVHLGLAARLTAPALAAAVLGAPLDLDPSRVWWRDADGGPAPLSVPSSGPPRGAWDALLLAEVLAPVTEAVARLYPVSRRVLRGNVASAVNTAARLVAAQRPDLAAAAWAAARGLFARPHLAAERHPPGPAFRRASCCLFYRLDLGAPRAYCADCVLR